MSRRTSKAAAVALALLFILTAPGFEAFQAVAAVTAQQHGSAPVGISAQVGSFGTLKPGSFSVLPQTPGSLSLQGSLSATPAPGVRTQAVTSAIPISAPSSPAARLAAPEEGAPIVTFLSPAVVSQAAAVAAPAEEARTTLGDLSKGAERISASSRQDGSGQAQRQAIDEMFLGRGLFAPAEVAATPLADSQPSGLLRAAAPGDSSPRGPPTAPSQRSLTRSLRVGWLAAIAPLVITFAATAVAQYFGYNLHPGYHSPAPDVLTVGTVAATAVMAAVMAPVSEEMLFRNGLMAGLRRIMRRIPLLGEFWLPALASSVVFVALHELSDPLLFATRLVHSLVLSYAYHKEGLASSVAAHAFFNGLLTLPMVLALLPGPIGLLANILTLPAIAFLTWRAFKALKAQAPDRASGRIQPLEITALPSLLLAALLLAGYFFLAPNPIWILGAVGYAWRAGRLALGKFKARRTPPPSGRA